MLGRRAYFAAASVAGMAAIGAIAWQQLEWSPRPFPACPEIPGETRTWERLTFSVPPGWTLVIGQNSSEGDGRKSAWLRAGTEYKDYVQGILLSEDPGADIRVDFGRQIPDPSAVARTVQRLKVDGRDGVLYLGRDTEQHSEEQGWEMLIDGGDSIFHIGGPDQEVRPSARRKKEVESLNCAYWSVVRSLKIR